MSVEANRRRRLPIIVEERDYWDVHPTRDKMVNYKWRAHLRFKVDITTCSTNKADVRKEIEAEFYRQLDHWIKTGEYER